MQLAAPSHIANDDVELLIRAERNDAAIVIATRPKDAPAGAMASLILEVPDLNKAIESAKAAGGSLLRPPGKSGTLMFAFLKDPDGNQVELVMSPK